MLVLALVLSMNSTWTRWKAILVRKAVARAHGNITQAAELLGLSRGALYRRLEKHGIAT